MNYELLSPDSLTPQLKARRLELHNLLTLKLKSQKPPPARPPSYRTEKRRPPNPVLPLHIHRPPPRCLPSRLTGGPCRKAGAKRLRRKTYKTSAAPAYRPRKTHHHLRHKNHRALFKTLSRAAKADNTRNSYRLSVHRSLAEYPVGTPRLCR